MFSKLLGRGGAALALTLLFANLAPAPANAIPLFAQRYRLECTKCHSVLPELNAFGNYFRKHGYRLPNVEKHGTSGVALRYQMEYEKDPPAGQRRWTPGGILLSNVDIGAVSAFVHYNLGAGGGPSALYLGYLSTYNAHTKVLLRAGYIELPLIQSPGQRLDDLAPYGYTQTRVGLNDLVLASPRIGGQIEKTVGTATFDATIAFGDYKGSAYGGKPVKTGEATFMSRPELGFFARVPVLAGIELTGDAMIGQRAIGVNGQPTFQDEYQRYAIGAHAREKNLDITVQQWYGYDGDDDGVGHGVASSGGFARLKYYLVPHAYLGIRYDTAANPYTSRDFVYYIGTQVTPHARVVLQDVHTLGKGKDALGGALTFGFPWAFGL